MELFNENELESLTDSELVGLLGYAKLIVDDIHQTTHQAKKLLMYANALKDQPYRVTILDRDFHYKPKVLLNRTPTTKWGYRIHAKHCIENKHRFTMGEELVVANRVGITLYGNKELGCYIYQVIFNGDLITLYFEIVDKDIMIVSSTTFKGMWGRLLKERIQSDILPTIKSMFGATNTPRYTDGHNELLHPTMTGKVFTTHRKFSNPWIINLRGHVVKTKEFMATYPEKLRTLDDFAMSLTEHLQGESLFFKAPINENINAAIIRYRREVYHDVYFEIEDLFPDNNTLITTLTEYGLAFNCIHLVRVRKYPDMFEWEIDIFNTDYPYQRKLHTPYFRKDSILAQGNCRIWKQLGVQEGFVVELLRVREKPRPSMVKEITITSA